MYMYKLDYRLSDSGLLSYRATDTLFVRKYFRTCTIHAVKIVRKYFQKEVHTEIPSKVILSYENIYLVLYLGRYESTFVSC